MSEEKKDQVLGHDFDGIEEYDNRLPNWWLAILYATVFFGFIYWIYFHTLGIGPSPQKRYQESLVKAAEAEFAESEDVELSNQTLEAMAETPTQVMAGREIFEQFCVVCHGESGEGGVGPNLTDDYWLHGGSPLEIHDTIMHGVPEKGMVAWEGQLGPRRVMTVAAYVLSLWGTNVAGKEPQGVPYVPPSEDVRESSEEGAPVETDDVN